MKGPFLWSLHYKITSVPHCILHVNTYFIFRIPDALGNLATKYATSHTTEYYHALHSTNRQAAQISLADDLG